VASRRGAEYLLVFFLADSGYHGGSVYDALMNLGLFQVVGLVGTGLRCFGYSVARMDLRLFRRRFNFLYEMKNS